MAKSKSKPKPKWKEFEDIVTGIQKVLVPDTEPQPNIKITGKSGIRRQVDVCISGKIGVYPARVVIECKRYTRVVDIGKIEAFVAKCWDIDASIKIFLSNTGFTKGARAVASLHDIKLLTYREAETADWNQIIGPNSWLTIVFCKMVDPVCTVSLEEETMDIEVSLGQEIYTSEGEPLNSFQGVFDNAWNRLGTPSRLGEGKFTVNVNDNVDEIPLYVQGEDGQMKRIVQIAFSGKIVAKMYRQPIQPSQGNILEDVRSQKAVYRRMSSQPFNWVDIVSVQPGVELEQVEYEEFLQAQNQGQFKEVLLSEEKPYLRLQFTDKQNLE